MGSSVNMVILLGRLGADAELRGTQSGKSVLNWRMATSEQWKDQQGQKQERTEWHSCVMWGNYAAAIAKYMSKGKRVQVTGKLQTREWQDKQGNRRFTTEINAEDVVLLDGGNQAGVQQSGGSRNYQPNNNRQTQQRPDNSAQNQGMPWDNAPPDDAPYDPPGSSDGPLDEHGQPAEGHPDHIPF